MEIAQPEVAQTVEVCSVEVCLGNTEAEVGVDENHWAQMVSKYNTGFVRDHRTAEAVHCWEYSTEIQRWE